MSENMNENETMISDDVGTATLPRKIRRAVMAHARLSAAGATAFVAVVALSAVALANGSAPRDRNVATSGDPVGVVATKADCLTAVDALTTKVAALADDKVAVTVTSVIADDQANAVVAAKVSALHTLTASGAKVAQEADCSDPALTTAKATGVARSMQAVADSLNVALHDQRVTVAMALRHEKVLALEQAIADATAFLTSSDGHVSDEAIRDALAKQIAAAQTAIDLLNATDVDSAVETVMSQATKVDGELTALSGAVAAVQASADAFAAANGTAPVKAGTSSTSGGKTSGGTTAPAPAAPPVAPPAPPAPAPGIVTWGACVGGGRDKFIDGEYAGGRSCAIAANVSAAIAAYQSSADRCGLATSYTADVESALVSFAASKAPAKYSVTQVDDNLVTVTAYPCPS